MDRNKSRIIPGEDYLLDNAPKPEESAKIVAKMLGKERSRRFHLHGENHSLFSLFSGFAFDETRRRAALAITHYDGTELRERQIPILQEIAKKNNIELQIPKKLRPGSEWLEEEHFNLDLNIEPPREFPERRNHFGIRMRPGTGELLDFKQIITVEDTGDLTLGNNHNLVEDLSTDVASKIARAIIQQFREHGVEYRSP